MQLKLRSQLAVMHLELVGTGSAATCKKLASLSAAAAP